MLLDRTMLRMMFGAARRRIDYNLTAANEGNDSSSETDTEVEHTTGADSTTTAADDYDLEPWPDFIKRVTHRMEESVEKLGMDDWVSLHRSRKWNFATNALSKSDGRWTGRLIKWRMSERPGRSPGLPVRRWSDDFCELAGGDWDKLATESELWSLLEHAFIHREEVQERVGSRF